MKAMAIEIETCQSKNTLIKYMEHSINNSN